MKLTGLFKVTKVKKKTQAVFFKGLKEGDSFAMSYSLNGWYHNAPTVDILQGGDVKHINTANQLRNNLANFDIEQVC